MGDTSNRDVELSSLIQKVLADGGVDCSLNTDYLTVVVELDEKNRLFITPFLPDSPFHGYIDMTVRTPELAWGVTKFLPECRGKPLFIFNEDSLPQMLERAKKTIALFKQGGIE